MNNSLGLKHNPAQLPSPRPESRGSTEYVNLSTSEISRNIDKLFVHLKSLYPETEMNMNNEATEAETKQENQIIREVYEQYIRNGKWTNIRKKKKMEEDAIIKFI